MTTEATATYTFTISTWADSRSNRRDRSYVIEAATAIDAKNEAIERACSDMRQWGRSVYATITDVDGKGEPVDCPHYDFIEGWDERADGSRVSPSCDCAR